jgi:hypothetical protein
MGKAEKLGSIPTKRLPPHFGVGKLRVSGDEGGFERYNAGGIPI